MAVHELKIYPVFFEDVRFAKKTFDLRKNDRNFGVGDQIIFHEFNPDGEFEDYERERGYTGHHFIARITYILSNFDGLLDSYCILGLIVSVN